MTSLQKGDKQVNWKICLRKVGSQTLSLWRAFKIKCWNTVTEINDIGDAIGGEIGQKVKKPR